MKSLHFDKLYLHTELNWSNQNIKERLLVMKCFL